MQSKELALAAARALDDKKGVKILVLDVQHLTIIADYFVIASGRSANQVRALIDEVDDKLSELGENPRRREGTKAAGPCWTTATCWYTYSMSRSASITTSNACGWTAPIRWSLCRTRTNEVNKVRRLRLKTRRAAHCILAGGRYVHNLSKRERAGRKPARRHIQRCVLR